MNCRLLSVSLLGTMHHMDMPMAPGQSCTHVHHDLDMGDVRLDMST